MSQFAYCPTDMIKPNHAGRIPFDMDNSYCQILMFFKK